MDKSKTSPTGRGTGTWRQAKGKIVGVVKITAKPGCAEALIELKREQFERQFNDEQATELYLFTRSLDDPNVFYNIEAFTNAAGLEHHFDNPALPDYVKKFYELVDKLEPVFLDLLQGKGLDVGVAP